MHRFFGSSKPQLDKPNLQSAIKNADERVSGIDLKIKKLEAELIRYKEQLRKLPNGSTRNNVQQKCTKLLQQRNMYNRQKEQIENQIFSMEQTEFTTENIKNSITTVKAMKEASKELKREYKKVNVEQIESLQDELADLIEDSSYIQEALGRGYEVPDDIDESELQAGKFIMFLYFYHNKKN
ncbi:hypothetical protein K502DRAFT_288565 [Neoconidiobolus thromboides FSU 785]|nr:hypothetical protein K502DRAFT_288565 [Neoconidiobolus thromboides FSU 785]